MNIILNINKCLGGRMNRFDRCLSAVKKPDVNDTNYNVKKDNKLKHKYDVEDELWCSPDNRKKLYTPKYGVSLHEPDTIYKKNNKTSYYNERED